VVEAAPVGVVVPRAALAEEYDVEICRPGEDVCDGG
jgi:hypothetical protein